MSKCVRAIRILHDSQYKFSFGSLSCFIYFLGGDFDKETLSITLKPKPIFLSTYLKVEDELAGYISEKPGLCHVPQDRRW